MTVRPVDMVTMLPRLTEASRLQHHNDSQPFVALHALTAQAAEKAVRDQQSVQQRTSAEQAEIHKDSSGSGGQEEQPTSRRDRRQEQPQEAAATDPQRGHRLDVKI